MSGTGGAAWMLRRLRTMSVAEIGWRAAAAGRALADPLRRAPDDAQLLADGQDWAGVLAAFRAGTGRPVLLDRSRARALATAFPEEFALVRAQADAVVGGRVQYFGYPETTLASPIDWHHDPIGNVRWPSVPSSRLDHRAAAGDAKWIWELNRLQHLPWLAQAWLVTDDERYADTAWAHLDGWLAQNPPGTGIAWRGAFEAGVRGISVAVALQGLRDSAGCTLDRFAAVVRMLSESARRCWTDRSRFSSANNHLVGELAGSAVIALLLPELRGSAARLERAVAGLARESRLQILPDGAGAEQAFGYQQFTGDLLLVVVALLRLAGRPAPVAMRDGLLRSAAYMAELLGDGDPVPRYGDDDEGFALRLDAAPRPEPRAHLAAVAATVGEEGGGTPGGLAAAWLGGDRARGGIPSVPAPHGRVFPDGGLVLLRSERRRITMDVGPLGYLSIAAHGHADALALTLAVDGRELIGDPGPGSYYGHPAWRTVHRSTRAHATVAVDGADQSVQGGSFLWTTRAVVRVGLADVERGIVDAAHDGYTRLIEPVQHRRRLIAPPDRVPVLVVDELTGDGSHEVGTSWPLAPELDARRVGRTRHEVSADGRLLLQIEHAATAPCTAGEVRGDEGTGLGWWSDRLEQRTPAWLLGATVRGPVPVVLATLLVPCPGPVVADLAVTRTDGWITVRWTEDGRPAGADIGPGGGAVVTEPRRGVPVDRKS